MGQSSPNFILNKSQEGHLKGIWPNCVWGFGESKVDCAAKLLDFQEDISSS